MPEEKKDEKNVEPVKKEREYSQKQKVHDHPGQGQSDSSGTHWSGQRWSGRSFGGGRS
jgi:hypothetical protein